jgi:transcriptional regulator with XRE-family HTH domain
MHIGETIRSLRLNKGMSQGDIERRTGLLPCYLSRVENGHTVPSLATLAKVASALDVPIAQLFHDSPRQTDPSGAAEARFLRRIERYSKVLGENDRKLIIAMVKKIYGLRTVTWQPRHKIG